MGGRGTLQLHFKYSPEGTKKTPRQHRIFKAVKVRTRDFPNTSQNGYCRIQITPSLLMLSPVPQITPSLLMLSPVPQITPSLLMLSPAPQISRLHVISKPSIMNLPRYRNMFDICLTVHKKLYICQLPPG